jgi:hypothetical protein
MVETGLLPLKNHDNLAYRPPVDKFSIVVVLNPFDNFKDSFPVEILGLIMSHHETDFYEL